MRSLRIPAGLFVGLWLLRLPLFGQDASATNTAAASAAAVAGQQGEDEKFKQVAADIESLRAANQVLTDKLSALTEENRQIRADLTRLAGDSTVQDQLKLLAQKIEVLAQKIGEVDKKRVDDKDAISQEIGKFSARIEKLLSEAAAPAPKSTNKPPVNSVPAEPQNGVKYTIKAGDRLPDILKSYNETFKSEGKKTITQRQVMEANPKAVWTNLQIGQQIVIPLPPE